MPYLPAENLAGVKANSFNVVLTPIFPDPDISDPDISGLNRGRVKGKYLEELIFLELLAKGHYLLRLLIIRVMSLYLRPISHQEYLLIQQTF
jgi:hypothetical protein